MEKKSIVKRVFDHCQSDFERGINILNMGYEECNDYAQSVTNVFNVTTKGYYRFETVSRYIRNWKEQKRKDITQL